MNLDNLLKELTNVMEQAPEALKKDQSEAILNTSGEGRVLVKDTISKMNDLIQNRDKDGLEKLVVDLKNIVK